MHVCGYKRKNLLYRLKWAVNNIDHLSTDTELERANCTFKMFVYSFKKSRFCMYTVRKALNGGGIILLDSSFQTRQSAIFTRFQLPPVGKQNMSETYKWGGCGVAQQLRTLAALTEDPSSVPRNHIRHLTSACNSSPRRSDTFFWLL